jgi:error-prone DNA polymerase
MGFYHPATLLHDARRHGVRIRPIDIEKSDWKCTIENDKSIRIGMKYVAGLRENTANKIISGRPFSSLQELWRKSGANQAEMITLASIGAFNAFCGNRRGALWNADALGRSGAGLFAETGVEEESPLDPMTLVERLSADIAGTGMSCGPHPMALERARLHARGILRAADLARLPDGARVEAAGTVIVRQRPGTAKGFFFVTLEDETGFSNAIVTPQRFAENRSLLTGAPALVIGGVLQNQDGVVSIKADRFRALMEIRRAAPSRDFH